MIEILHFLLCFVLILVGVGALAVIADLFFVLMEKFFDFIVAHPKIEAISGGAILGVLITVVAFSMVEAALLLCKILSF